MMGLEEGDEEGEEVEEGFDYLFKMTITITECRLMIPYRTVPMMAAKEKKKKRGEMRRNEKESDAMFEGVSEHTAT